MRYIRLTDSKKRDARVQYVSPSKKKRGGYRNADGEEIKSYRFINDTEGYNPQNLLALHEDKEELAEELINGDPEIDDETQKALDDGKILETNFNYYAGYNLSTLFIMKTSESIFGLVGEPTNFEYCTHDAGEILVEDDEDEDFDDMDFGML